MAGLDTVREVVGRSTQTGRLRLDIALLHKEKSQLLQTLGEIVVGLVDDGTWEDVPESVHQTIERITEVEGQIKNDSIKAHDNAFGAPRGYEPEAATDYGDEESATGDDAHEASGDDENGHDHETAETAETDGHAEAAHAAPARRVSNSNNTGTKKKTPQKRRSNHTR